MASTDGGSLPSLGAVTTGGPVEPGVWSSPPREVHPSRAVPALTLAIVGLLCCGALAVVGAAMGASELRAIDAGRVDPSKRATARAALVIGAIGTILWLMAVVGYALLVRSVVGQL